MNLRTASSALLLLLALPLHAEIYKWTDANGKVHYGDQPPTSSKSSTVAVKPNSSSGERSLPAKSGDGRVRSGLYSGLKGSEADKIRETCQREGRNMSLAEIRDNYCGMEYAGCRALREYQQETENSVARHRGEGGAAQSLGDAMLRQLKTRMSEKGC